jgi:hypothetical protein
MLLELLYFDGCPGFADVLPRARRLAEGRAELRLVAITSFDEAEAHRFLGSPTVRVDGEDIEFGTADRTDFGMKCRLYRTSDGFLPAPPDAWIRRALDGA